MDESAARSAFDQAMETYHQSFGTFFLAKLLGLDITYGADGSTIRLPVRDFLFNPQGSLHGGIIALVADVAMGHLLKHEFGVAGATLEIKVQYLKPVRGPEAYCQGRFLRKGRSISFMEARFFDSGDVLAAVATATWRSPQQSESA